MTNQAPIRKSEFDEDHPINALRRILVTRKQQLQNIEQLMQEFCNRLFSGMETAVHAATQAGIPALGTPRRIQHPAGGWRQALQVIIEDWSVIIVPLVGAAWPNPRDEAQIPGARFKEPCGRIALFVGEDQAAESFYDFLIYSDGFWFAWGYGWPRVADSIEQTDFEVVAFEMLASFVKDIHTTWRPRKMAAGANYGTLLSQSLDAKKRAYTYGLPGEE
ncbi:MAG: hypothetical protein HS103_04215 [Anaerolineales bacterium]|nr:hypothetical protein [Anaerolineales bacterium]